MTWHAPGQRQLNLEARKESGLSCRSEMSGSRVRLFPSPELFPFETTSSHCALAGEFETRGGDQDNNPRPTRRSVRRCAQSPAQTVDSLGILVIVLLALAAMTWHALAQG